MDVLVNRFKANVVANFTGGAWTGLMTLIFVPVYLHLLGIEAYALVAFFTTLQAVFGILDLGLKSTLNREIARLRSREDFGHRATELVRTLEIPYWGIAVAIGLVIVVFAKPVAYSWINTESLSPVTVRRAVVLMGLVIAFRWPLSFYSGGLQGLERQISLNAINAGAATVRGVGAVLALLLVAPTIEVFFIWQAIVAVGHTALVASVTWRCLPASPIPPRFNRAVLRDVSPFAAGVSGATALGVVLMQLDKIILSGILSLEAFGFYSIASIMSLSLYRFIHPIYSATYPQFSRLLSAGSSLEVERTYHRACQLVSVCALPVAVILCIYSKQILLLWTQDPTVAERTYRIASVLVVGTAFAGLGNIPYALQLASGWTSLSVYVNLAAVAVTVPLMIVLTSTFGAVGAASCWLMVNGVSLAVTTRLIHRRLLPQAQASWYRQDIGAPMLVAVCVAGAYRLVVPLSDNRLLMVVHLLGCAALTLLATGYSALATRRYIAKALAWAH
jgi:O-antigen/teichoic acid export membrane protein